MHVWPLFTRLLLPAGTTEPANTEASVPRRDVFRGYIPELDALRAIGIIVVVLNHTFPQYLSFKIAHALALGWAFMDSFFVMSGFLITGILLDTKARPDYFRSFYIRRAFRILPLYYLLIGSLTIGLYLSGGDSSTWASPWWFFVYLGNIPTAITGNWQPHLGDSFIPLWSLQIEEQFYLLFPLLVRFSNITTLKRLLICMIPFSLATRILIYYLWPDNAYIQYVLLPCRLEGFALGALIAMRYRSGPWAISKSRLTVQAIVWTLLTACVGFYGGYEHTMPLIRTLGFSVSSVASAYIVLWLIEFRNSSVTAALRTSVVQHLGKISYGIYLLHIPIVSALAVIFAPHFPPGWRSLPALIIVGPLSILLASLSWAYFESPILKFKDKFSKAPKPAANIAINVNLPTASAKTKEAQISTAAAALSFPHLRTIESAQLHPSRRSPTTDGTPTRG